MSVTTDNVVSTYDEISGRWNLSILNTNEGIKEALVILKDALRENRLNEKKVLEQNIMGLQPISDFINYCCYPHTGRPILPEELKRVYCHFCGIDNSKVTTHKFGKMMTEFINSDLNIQGVRRKAVRTGTAYVGIRLKSMTEINAILSEEEPITHGTDVDDPNMVEQEEVPHHNFTPSRTVMTGNTPKQLLKETLPVRVPSPVYLRYQVPKPLTLQIPQQPVIQIPRQPVIQIPQTPQHPAIQIPQLTGIKMPEIGRLVTSDSAGRSMYLTLGNATTTLTRRQ